MVIKSIIGASCACFFASFTVNAAPISGQGTWETTLQGRDLDGDATTIEAYYDTILGITWLADANYSQTSGFDTNGKLGWTDANAWVDNLDINGITGWRLPTVSPVSGLNYNTSLTSDGTTDRGTARTTTDGSDGGWRDSSFTPASEMGHMYYVNLGNLGRYDPDLDYVFGLNEQEGWGLNNTGPITNLFADAYMTGTEATGTGFDSSAFYFAFDSGTQSILSTVYNDPWRVWAVHDGAIGVAAVPIPSALWLFGSGLLGLVGVARRKKA